VGLRFGQIRHELAAKLPSSVERLELEEVLDSLPHGVVIGLHISNTFGSARQVFLWFRAERLRVAVRDGGLRGAAAPA
jgi:hypothetical protein